jgi:hypothetical protein
MKMCKTGKPSELQRLTLITAGEEKLRQNKDVTCCAERSNESRLYAEPRDALSIGDI